mgnify:CR=1 FL=1
MFHCCCCCLIFIIVPETWFSGNFFLEHLKFFLENFFAHCYNELVYILLLQKDNYHSHNTTIIYIHPLKQYETSEGSLSFRNQFCGRGNNINYMEWIEPEKRKQFQFNWMFQMEQAHTQIYTTKNLKNYTTINYDYIPEWMMILDEIISKKISSSSCWSYPRASCGYYHHHHFFRTNFFSNTNTSYRHITFVVSNKYTDTDTIHSCWLSLVE